MWYSILLCSIPNHPFPRVQIQIARIPPPPILGLVTLVIACSLKRLYEVLSYMKD